MGDVLEITTTPFTESRFYRFTGNAMVFEVKGRSSAIINLSESPKSKKRIMVIIGINNNTQCLIKPYNKRSGPVYLPNLLSEDEYRKFWLTWFDGTIALGQHGHSSPILISHANNDIDINVVEFVSEKNDHHPLNWRFILPPQIPSKQLKTITGGEPKWLPLINKELPEDAIIAGHDEEPIYIIRAHHEYSLTPGKYMPSMEMGFIPWGGEAHAKGDLEDLEILCGYNYMWVYTTNCRIPVSAVVGGYSEVDREVLYIGRTNYITGIIVGKVQPSHKGLYIPAHGSEVFKDKFEILVCPNNDDKYCIDSKRVYYREDTGDYESSEEE